MSSILDTLANPVGSLLGAGLSSGLNYLGTMQAQQQQADLMKQQMEFSERMQDKQNEFNDPRLQAQRMRAAGINPALGQGSTPISSMASAGAQLPNAPATPQFRVPEGFGDTFAKAFQGNTNRIQANAYDSLSKSQQRNFDINNDLLMATFDDKVIQARLQNEDIKQKIGESQKRIEHMQTEMNSMEENVKINWFNAYVDQRWKDISGKNLAKQMQVFQAQVEDYKNQINNRDKLTSATAYELYKRVKLEESQINMNDKQAALTEQEAIYRKALNDFFEQYPEFLAMPAGVAKACTLLDIPEGFANVYTTEEKRSGAVGPVRGSSSNQNVVTSDGKTLVSTSDYPKDNSTTQKNTEILMDVLNRGEKIPLIYRKYYSSLLNDCNLSESQKKQIKYLIGVKK